MNSICRFIKCVLFVPAIAVLNVVLLASIIWASFRAAALSFYQLLSRVLGRNGDAVALAKQHLAAVAQLAASHKERADRVSTWCFKGAPSETAEPDRQRTTRGI
jgi:hypothetical protein